MKNKNWSIEDFERAVLMLKNGKSYQQIAQKIGRTPKSVKVKLNKNKLSFIRESKIVKKCLYCNEEFNSTRFNEKKFCNNSCAAKFNNPKRKKKRFCLNCEKELNYPQKKYCSNKCQKIFEENEVFKKIENGDVTFSEYYYKRYLIRKHGEKCMECGWNKRNPYSKNIPIELEHVDGNPENNNLKNLKLLCPSCHSLTPTYKALNVGNGRYKRRKRYQDKKSY